MVEGGLTLYDKFYHALHFLELFLRNKKFVLGQCERANYPIPQGEYNLRIFLMEYFMWKGSLHTKTQMA
jgi:hypothetical protein